MGTTTKGLPYPEVTDKVQDGATAIKNLALAVDTAIPVAGAWAAWTPTLSNVTLGNGTVTATWKQVSDKVAAVRFRLVFGSTTTVSGGIGVGGLPFAPAGEQVSHGHAQQGSGANRYPVSGNALVSAGNWLANRVYVPAGGTGATATAPFTWTSGDALTLTAVLEIA